MSIVTFTDLYVRTRNAILKKTWPDTRKNSRDFLHVDWNYVVNNLCNLSLLLGANGPDYNYEAGLHELRESLKGQAMVQQKSIGQILVGLNESARRNNRSISPFAFNIKRVAAMKVLYHLYFVRRRGAQGVWVYSPPVSNRTWAFYALNRNRSQLAAKLNANDEYYSQDQRDLLRDGSEMALNWVNQTLGRCSTDTYADYIIGEWFIGTNLKEDTEERMRHYRSLVRRYLQAMANMLNSNTIVFSYHPDLGSVKEADTLGFVYDFERLDVIYMSNKPHSRACNSDVENCTLTILHEVSHRALVTDDHSYGWQGLKPAATGFTTKKALDNADSWAYFIADACGKLRVSRRNSVLVHKYR